MVRNRLIAGIFMAAVLFQADSVMAFHVANEGAAQADVREASIYNVETDQITSSSSFNCDWTYRATTPKVVNFWDDKGCYNVASYAGGVLTIDRYRTDLTFESKLELTNPYASFGTVTCDDAGNYYVVWAQNDTNKVDSVVTSLVKYDYTGAELGRCEITGYNSNPYIEWGTEGNYWGTMNPFDAGSCELAISNGIISCNYARKMYSGHQSNYIFYVNTSTMERLYPAKNVPYCSHSFDQDVIATSDGGFLFANHGDASKRGFHIAKVKDGVISGETVSFHFREGTNRSYGYNETYAQLGGLCETDNTYVLCASSEKTLSLECAPTNQEYCGHSEARNLFVQIFKKDFYNYSGENMYYTSGATRSVTGTKPESALTNLYLNGSEVDYGVIWLTELDDDYYVCNPKIMNIGSGQFVVLWEELAYANHEGQAYYEVLDEAGQVIVGKTQITNTYLMGNTDLTYHNDCVYWATNDSNGQLLHQMDITEHNYVERPNCDDSSNQKYICADCGKIWENGPTLKLTAGHVYGEPSYQWSSDYSSCEIVLTCIYNFNHTQKYDAVVTSKIMTQADCTHKGKTRYTATYGDYSDYIDVQNIPIDSDNHPYLMTDEAVDATCTTSGLTEGTHCYYCGAIETAQQVIPALGHHLLKELAIEATCVSTGKDTCWKCDRCDTYFMDEEGKEQTTLEIITKPIDPHKHTGAEEIRNIYVGNCREDGYSGDTYCLSCGVKIADGISTGKNANIHVGGTELLNKKEATDTELGYTGDTYCTGCGELLANGTYFSKTIQKISKKPQTITVSKKVSKTVSFKASKLKKKKAVFFISAKASGKVSYKVTKGSAKYIKVSSGGKVTLKKGCKKGTYKIKITAQATDEYNSASRIVTIKVK